MDKKRKVYRPGRANFESSFLEFTPESIRVKYTLKSLFFYGIFAVIGAGVIVCAGLGESDESSLPLYVFGTVFFTVGTGFILRAVKRAYPEIDMQRRLFYPSGKRMEILPGDDNVIPLNELQKIKIDSHWVRTSKNSYRCYTLSLLFSGNREFILLNHGALKAFMRDAEALGRRLDMPLPQEDFEAKILAGNKKVAPFMIAGALLWIGVVVWINSQVLKEEGIAGVIFSAPFLLFGIILLGSAIKMLKGKK
ncbi:MAG: hypothetical protein IKC82_06245 [Lentisphaeria bacterium]|nr:hypothetical protein [Lentisphaeria bacterium]